MRLPVCYILFFFLFFATGSYAQKDTIHLKEVEVKEQFPVFPGVNKNNADTMRLMKSVSASLSDVLSYEPGLMIKRYGDGGLATVSFRGADASHTKVDWNGLPVNSVMNGQVDFSLIPACPSDHIDLFYGANSMAFSQGSLGGTIRLNSAGISNLTNGIELKSEWGSFGLFNEYGGLVFGNKKWKSFTRLSYHTSENNYPYMNTSVIPNERMTQSDARFERINVMEELFVKLKKSELSVHYWQTNADREIPPLMTNVFSARNVETQSDASSRFITTWNYSNDCFKFYLREGISYSSLYYNLEHYSDNFLVTYIHSRSYEFSNFSGAGMRYCFSPRFIVNSTVDYLSSSVNISEEKSSQGYSKTNGTLNAMIDAESYLLKWVNVSGLARVYKQDNFPAAVSPALYFSFRQGKKLSFKTAFSKNSNFPTLNDMYFVPGGNPSLKPETGYQSDITTIYSGRIGKSALYSETGLFYSDINNWILWQPTQYGYWTPENVKRVVSKGAQVKLSCKIPIHENNVFFTGGYTYNMASSVDDQKINSQLPYLPVHSGFVSLRLNVRKFEFYAEQIIQGKRVVSSNYGYFNDLDPYFITNASLQYKFSIRKSDLSIELRLNNIFNESYQLISWRPVPGRNGSVVISFRI